MVRNVDIGQLQAMENKIARLEVALEMGKNWEPDFQKKQRELVDAKQELVVLQAEEEARLEAEATVAAEAAVAAAVAAAEEQEANEEAKKEWVFGAKLYTISSGRNTIVLHLMWI